MKILVIPDVHLKPFMFIRAKELLKKGIAEQAVCLMDIPDDWQKQYQLEEYVKTYEEAIAFAKAYPNSLWCYGNHDVCYLWNERESGYSPIAPKTVCQQMAALQDILSKDNPIRFVHKVDNVLFCHGGVSRYFVEKYVPDDKYDDVSYVVDTINSLDHYDMWCDDSPIWYRPQYYKGKMYQSETVLHGVGQKETTNENYKLNDTATYALKLLKKSKEKEMSSPAMSFLPILIIPRLEIRSFW